MHFTVLNLFMQVTEVFTLIKFINTLCLKIDFSPNLILS